MDKKNENLQKQEEQAKEVISEIKSEYTKTADFLEEHTNQQIVIAKEMKEEMQNKDFDPNIMELKALKEEITGLKAEIKRLNEMENIGLSSLIVRDIKAVGNTLVHLQEKAIGSIKHLYDNMKNQLSCTDENMDSKRTGNFHAGFYQRAATKIGYLPGKA